MPANNTTTVRPLVELYSILLDRVRFYCPLGICSAMRSLRFHNDIHIEEFDRMYWHFLTIPRPEGAKESAYYWPPGEKEPRIEFLESIIKTLESSNHE